LKLEKPLKACGYPSTQNFRGFFSFLAFFALVGSFCSALLGFEQSNAAVATPDATALVCFCCAAS
jgi:hypothetical protein